MLHLVIFWSLIDPMSLRSVIPARRVAGLPAASRFLLACLVLLALLMPVATRGKEAVTWIESYDEALAEARRTGKPIFLEFRCAP